MSKRIACVMTSMAVLGLVVSGCMTGAKGPTPEELITTALTEWKTAIEAENVDGAMAVVSDEYVGIQGEGKDAMKDFLQNAKDNGDMAGIEIILEDVEITVEDDAGEAGPVDLSGSFGGISLMMEFAKSEDGAWRIASMGEY
ncbi:MAG: nuclear transport factor 2 family protein [bacterium]|nr:nuclear transport factor 2 family protein [bacterium]